MYWLEISESISCSLCPAYFADPEMHQQGPISTGRGLRAGRNAPRDQFIVVTDEAVEETGT